MRTEHYINPFDEEDISEDEFQIEELIKECPNYIEWISHSYI